MGDFTFYGIPGYNPLNDFGFDEDIPTSLLALGIMYIGFTFIAYLIMKLVAARNT